MSVTFKVPRQQRRPWFRRPRPATYRGVVEGMTPDRPGEAWERLADALRDLNLTACGVRRRIRCMEPLLQASRRLQTSLEEKLALERFPLSEETAEYAESALEVWSRLVVGYRCALQELDRRERNGRGDIALRGLQCLGRLLLTCYHQYMPEPPGAWEAVHECREAVGDTARDADGPVGDAGDAPDAATAYKQLIVLAATGPLRLRQREQAAVYRVLAHWARHVSVRPLRGAHPKGPPIVFRPGEDEAPRQYPLDQMPEAPGLRLIDPGPLAGRARHRLELIESGDHATQLSGEFLDAETLRVLLAAWSGAPSRQFPRSETGQATALAVGLEPAWQALRGRDRPSVRCQVADRSAAGFRVVLDRARRGLVEVGELVAAHDGNTWMLGIVRWIRQGNGSGLQLGVEAVSREPRAIRIRADGGNGTWPALLIEGNRAAHHPASLLTPRVRLREHSSVVVDESGEFMTLGRLLETTGALYRFRVEEPEESA